LPTSLHSTHSTFLRKYVKPKPGRALIVGSKLYGQREDRRRAYAEAVGVDMQPGNGVDVVLDLEEDGAALTLGTFAHIECWSTLEHSRRPWLLAATLESLLEPGGTIHLTVPFAWRLHNYGAGDFWRFTPDGVRLLFPGITWVKLMFAQDKLRENGRTPVLNKNAEVGPSWIARTEVFGFGVRA
jgi:hypothetical protein